MTIDTHHPSPDRLDQIERLEIPRIRAALSEWVDDGLLVERLRRLEDEAERLRRVLAVDDPTRSFDDGVRWLG
jgi:hypothetical protein